MRVQLLLAFFMITCNSLYPVISIDNAFFIVSIHCDMNEESFHASIPVVGKLRPSGQIGPAISSGPPNLCNTSINIEK